MAAYSEPTHSLTPFAHSRCSLLLLRMITLSARAPSVSSAFSATDSDSSPCTAHELVSTRDSARIPISVMWLSRCHEW